MIIPVRCMTCGKLLANKYEYYESELLRKKLALNSNIDTSNNTGSNSGSNSGSNTGSNSSSNSSNINPLIININALDIKKTIAGEILDDLGLHRMCCRKVMLTSINIINEI